jgi:hypothetical protein
MRTFSAPNTSTSLQTTLAADAHLAEGQFLLEEQTLNNNNNNNLAYGAEPFLRSCQLCSHSGNSQQF